ncbi:MAG: gpW family head-tail joining protein [Pyrinomonadaceae bacterium]|jgi:hypothetical protein
MTPEQKAILEQRLAAAETAYHNLTIGVQGKVFVDANGERIETTPANAGRLAAYINDLKRQLGLVVSSGPMQVWF